MARDTCVRLETPDTDGPMQFEFLINRPDAIPVIGRWYNEEWGRPHRDEKLEETIESLHAYLNVDRIPFILVATENDTILGAAQLKYREMANIYPDKEHWLGGVYVLPEHRGRGLGSRLANEIASRAPAHDVDVLYLQTERLDGGLYRPLGWKPIEQVNNNGIEVLVMQRAVGS